MYNVGLSFFCVKKSDVGPISGTPVEFRYLEFYFSPHRPYAIRVGGDKYAELTGVSNLRVIGAKTT